MCDANAPMRITVQVDQKVGLGGSSYGSASVGIILSGLTVETTEEEMQAMLDKGKIAYDMMREKVSIRARNICAAQGVGYDEGEASGGN